MWAHLYSFILKVFVVHQQFNYDKLGLPREINIYTIIWIQDGIYTWCNTNIVHINNIIWLDEIYTLFWSLFLNQGLPVILTRREHVLTKQAMVEWYGYGRIEWLYLESGRRLGLLLGGHIGYVVSITLTRLSQVNYLRGGYRCLVTWAEQVRLTT